MVAVTARLPLWGDMSIRPWCRGRAGLQVGPTLTFAPLSPGGPCSPESPRPGLSMSTYKHKTPGGSVSVTGHGGGIPDQDFPRVMESEASHGVSGAQGWTCQWPPASGSHRPRAGLGDHLGAWGAWGARQARGAVSSLQKRRKWGAMQCAHSPPVRLISAYLLSTLPFLSPISLKCK